VIRYNDVVAFLTAACPTYEGSAERAAVDVADGEYVAVTSLVKHLIRLLDEADTQSFPAVFGVVEWILEDGESAAVDLIHAGFVADLADRSFYEGRHVGRADFVQWFGPRMRRDPNIQAAFSDENR
jgi:hypothetical protein